MACRPLYETILDELRDIHPRANAEELLKHLNVAMFVNADDPRVRAYAAHLQRTGEEVV